MNNSLKTPGVRIDKGLTSIFKSFPNPHIRTSSFLINAKIFLDFLDKKKIISKEHTWEIESGRDNLTSYFENNNLKGYLDGKLIIEAEDTNNPFAFGGAGIVAEDGTMCTNEISVT